MDSKAGWQVCFEADLLKGKCVRLKLKWDLKLRNINLETVSYASLNSFFAWGIFTQLFRFDHRWLSRDYWKVPKEATFYIIVGTYMLVFFRYPNLWPFRPDSYFFLKNGNRVTPSDISPYESKAIHRQQLQLSSLQPSGKTHTGEQNSRLPDPAFPHSPDVGNCWPTPNLLALQSQKNI